MTPPISFQIGFSSISAFISSLDSTVKQATISHMQEDELDRRDHRPISVTITPPIRQGTPSSSFEYLTFHNSFASSLAAIVTSLSEHH